MTARSCVLASCQGMTIVAQGLKPIDGLVGPYKKESAVLLAV